jgi:lambda repressor-like predicted transcriptional regulator
MADETGPVVDLLGDPWTPPRDPRGRKRHRRLPQVAETVALLRATGLTVEQVAGRVGLSEPTLRRYYLRELDKGEDLVEALLNEAMWQKAKAGNVSAARFIREQLQKGQASAALERRASPATRLGKKEERQQAAANITGKFTPPAPPKFIVN